MATLVLPSLPPSIGDPNPGSGPQPLSKPHAAPLSLHVRWALGTARPWLGWALLPPWLWSCLGQKENALAQPRRA